MTIVSFIYKSNNTFGHIWNKKYKTTESYWTLDVGNNNKTVTGKNETKIGNKLFCVY